MKMLRGLVEGFFLVTQKAVKCAGAKSAAPAARQENSAAGIRERDFCTRTPRDRQAFRACGSN